MAEKCKECGCMCARCTQNAHLSDMHLHAEIENLRQRLMERDSHIVTMETQFLNEADKFPNGELASIKEEILMWQDKYTRLHDAHKRVQKVNQNLEDKLLRIVDKCETEKGAFTKDIATLSHRLADANYTIHRLTQDNERYRSDVSLAIQLLQCKPSNFVGQKYESLPSEVQAKVRSYVSQKRRSSDVSAPETKSIRVPISTFPPTAMVFNISKTNSDKHSDDDDSDDKPPIDVISAAIMAKVLEDREKERIFAKHCDTCTCHRSILAVDAETQTLHDPSTEKSRDTLTKCDKTTMNSYESSTTACFSKNDTKNLDYSKHDKGYLNMKNVKRQAGKKPSFPHSKNSEKQSSKQIGNSNTSQSQIDIINDRLWKNGWHKVPEKSSSNDETEIDVINNRIWKNDKSKSKDSQLTVIEVRNAESRESIPLMANETSATSPSFSSDSVVISTSDPSSSSSDALIQCIGEKQRLYNHKSNSSLHEKGITGRNCLMRVTPGSKNILLDNAGHYETVLYTSGSYRANTALVHSGKSRTGRSASTSSDESAAVLPHDNTQLQRVAEWVQSSINRDNSTIGKCVDSSVDQMNGSNRSKAKDLMGSDFPNEGGESEKKPIGSQDSSKDLITFDVTNDEKVDKRSVNKKASMDYDIKITKEMEETYLKLAASLDPVALSLSSSTTDLTIEKYRKDHKRLQKTLDKSGSSG